MAPSSASRRISGAILPGANVTLTEVQTASARTSVTDPAGAFEFQNLTQGLYRIDVELGFWKSPPSRFESKRGKQSESTHDSLSAG